MKESVTALLPARSGSKGIPGKNLRLLGGISLLERAIDRARAAGRIDRVIVTTDSAEIRDLALARGAEAPFLRPAELARDETPMLPVIAHAHRELLKEGRPAGILALLQPTSPFLRPETIDRGIALLESGDSLLLKAVKRVREHPAWMLRREDSALLPLLDGPVLRRQDLPELFFPTGGLYLYRRAYLDRLTGPSPARLDPPIAWVEVDWPESIDIDEPRDLELAEWVLERAAAAARSAPGSGR